MAVKVLIPTPLRQYINKSDAVFVEGKTVEEILNNLTKQYSSLRKHLYSEEGKLRNFVNIYVNDDDCRYLKREKTEVSEKDIISIVPSIAGGRHMSAEEISLSREEISRYSRHLIMPEVGTEGQKKLKSSSVLLIGAGGLGSPLAMYLAAAGVGRIGIVDFDVVDFSNLQRQIIHSTDYVGKSKLESARKRLLGINPNIQIDTHETNLSSENAMEILNGYDIIADGTDNFPTRYLVNDACVLLGKPNVYGSIFRFEGQASVFYSKKGPCYRCLYSEPPPPGLVPSCAEGGVLGVLPGIIGTIQAIEVIKLIIGQGETLIGRLLLFDALKMSFRELKLRKNPNCPICSEHPTIKKLIDYEQFCGVVKKEETSENLDITVEELKEKLDKGEKLFLLDVREVQEYEICHIEGSTLIPLGQLHENLHKLNTADNIVAYCKMGGRSKRAVEFLKQVGFIRIKNLKGGIDAWAQKIDKKMSRY